MQIKSDPHASVFICDLIFVTLRARSLIDKDLRRLKLLSRLPQPTDRRLNPVTVPPHVARHPGASRCSTPKPVPQYRRDSQFAREHARLHAAQKHSALAFVSSL